MMPRASPALMPLSTRATTAEIIDGEGFSPSELAGNLADMELYNRRAGGSAVIRRAVDEILKQAPERRGLRLLDVGAGSGDIAADQQERSSRLRPGMRTLVVAVDRSDAVLQRARRDRGTRIRLIGAEAAALPFADATFDVAWSSLVLHHLDEPSIVKVLAELKRVTRLGFAVSDLRRSVPALAAVWMLTRLTSRNRMTRHDGPLSVRRALRPPELVRLAGLAGLEPRGPSGAGYVLRRSGTARLVLVQRHAPAAGAP